MYVLPMSPKLFRPQRQHALVRGVTLPLNVLLCITIIGGEPEKGLDQQLSWIDPKFFHSFKNFTSKLFFSTHPGEAGTKKAITIFHHEGHEEHED
jgi:hypothetical protein